MKSFGFLEFFAGAGLARIALEPEWRCLWANDIDEKKGEMYRANFTCPDVLETADIKQLSWNRVPRGAMMAWASFPCQDLSLAGNLSGIEADRSGTFFDFKRIIEGMRAEARPPILVIENVPGMLNGDNFAILCEHLAALNYTMGALVMDARYFVPQSRSRVFLVGVAPGLDVTALTSALAPNSLWFPSNLLKAWARLPDDVQKKWVWWSCDEPPRQSTNLASLIEKDPEGTDWHSEEKTEYIVELMDDANLAKVQRAQASGRAQVGFIYRRTRKGVQRAEVRFDGVAGCLRTPSGGSSRQTVMLVNGESIRTRLLSPREAARLMGVPDNYKLTGSYNDIYKAMGDGVAVPVVRWLSRRLLLPLAHLCLEQRESYLNEQYQVCSA